MTSNWSFCLLISAPIFVAIPFKLPKICPTPSRFSFIFLSLSLSVTLWNLKCRILLLQMAILTSGYRARLAVMCPRCLCLLLVGPRTLLLTSPRLFFPRHCHPDLSGYSFGRNPNIRNSYVYLYIYCNVWWKYYLFHGHVNSPHHFSILVRVFSACFISALMVLRLPSTLSSCCPCSSSICSVPAPVAWVCKNKQNHRFHFSFVDP